MCGERKFVCMREIDREIKDSIEKGREGLAERYTMFWRIFSMRMGLWG